MERGQAGRRRHGRAVEKLDLPTRMRRNRKAEWSRRLVRENAVTTDD